MIHNRNHLLLQRWWWEGQLYYKENCLMCCLKDMFPEPKDHHCQFILLPIAILSLMNVMVEKG